MKKVNEVLYNKLLAQAEEAKTQGLTSLASGILEAIGPYPNDEESEYSRKQLEAEIHHDLWKIATRLLHYHNVESLDAEKLDEEIRIQAEKLVGGLEQVIGVDSISLGPWEPKLPGQS